MAMDIRRVIQRIRIPLGFVFAAVFIIFARPWPMSVAIGAAIALAGLGIRAWASGHIRKSRRLAVTGPYAYTRNPLYVGSFLMGVGFSVAAGVWWLAAIFAGLFIGIYYPVMRVEEGDLRNHFGNDFEEYERSVPLFVPRLTPWKKTGGKFDIQLYLHYREYRAALGVVAVLALLAFEAFYLGPIIK